MQIDTSGARAAAQTEEVRLDKFINSSATCPPAAFGHRMSDGGKVFISAGTTERLSYANFREGDVVELVMGVNDKWLRGQTDAKWYAFHANIKPQHEEEGDMVKEDLIDLMEGSENGGKEKKDRTAEREKADELLNAGGVWTQLTLTNRIMGENATKEGELSEEGLKVYRTIGYHVLKRHRDNTLQKISMYREEDQSIASYVFWTAFMREVADSLRNAS
jgi:hypothetical protein